MLQKGLITILVSLVAMATACAAKPGGQTATSPSFGSHGYAWPPETLSGSAAAWQAPGGAKLPPDEASPAGFGSRGGAFMPVAPPLEHVGVAGDGCLDSLSATGVEFDQVESVRGVDTPVVVTSSIGQVRYYANGDLPLLLDCRMALTLANISAVLREQGVSEVRFSGAYVYRMSSKGRLSLHARGLALDIHELTVFGEKLAVKSAFTKGLGAECTANYPALNRVACALKSSGVFKELLTPDYDADHHDHFHIAIAPLAEGA